MHLVLADGLPVAMLNGQPQPLTYGGKPVDAALAGELAALIHLRDVAAELAEAESKAAPGAVIGPLRARLEMLYRQYTAGFGDIGRPVPAGQAQRRYEADRETRWGPLPPLDEKPTEVDEDAWARDLDEIANTTSPPTATPAPSSPADDQWNNLLDEVTHPNQSGRIHTMTAETETINLIRTGEQGTETIVITFDGHEVHEVYTLNGTVFDDSWQAAGPGGASDINEWLRERLIELRADGYRDNT